MFLTPMEQQHGKSIDTYCHKQAISDAMVSKITLHQVSCVSTLAVFTRSTNVVVILTAAALALHEF